MIKLDTTPEAVKAFVTATFEGRGFWGLTQGEEWVICDSAQFEESDVLPLWSTEAAAKAHCIDDWSHYQITFIPLEEFFEFWLNDLNEDGVLVGCDWPLDGDAHEMDAMELAKLYRA
ncbi:DUF2750 domain-containing protein [Ferrimonas sediminicola]|uniref:DUF2750 domain-containing protein n=1 Tax=Ferrimonas sediminicola TaxID=2569538 RepID=A0A4V5NVH0_9GAMM|nr:DUF2750 domain-containing protein [Ferrimonas sediminicola]TKB50483.1 DUF2750 domain-containing protein [Ferrimonas sediminicola]